MSLVFVTSINFSLSSLRYSPCLAFSQYFLPLSRSPTEFEAEYLSIANRSIKRAGFYSLFLICIYSTLPHEFGSHEARAALRALELILPLPRNYALQRYINLTSAQAANTLPGDNSLATYRSQWSFTISFQSDSMADLGQVMSLYRIRRNPPEYGENFKLDMLGILIPWADVCVSPNACLMQILANSKLLSRSNISPNRFMVTRENWDFSLFFFLTQSSI